MDEKLKQKEIEDIKAFAKANGFDCIIEGEKDFKPFVVTKEILDAQ